MYLAPDIINYTMYWMETSEKTFIKACNRKLSSPVNFAESVMETYKVLLTFQSVDEIPGCDHSNETSSAVLLHGTIYIEVFCKMKFEICLKF